MRKLFLMAALIAFLMAGTRAAAELGWDRIWNSRWGFAQALAWQCLNVSSQFALWWGLVGGVKVLGASQAYRSFAWGAVSRYLPAGTVLQFAGMAAAGGPAESLPRRLSAFACLTLAGLVGGLVLASSSQGWIGPILAALGIVVVIALARSGWLKSRVPSRFLPALAPLEHPAFFLIAVVGSLLLGWLPEGLAAKSLAASLHNSQVAGLTTLELLEAYALSALAGYLAFFAPGGIGVRELALVSLISPRVGSNEAILLALGMRLSLLTAEMIFLLPLLGMRSSKRAA